jgi:hypothetical protein
MLQYSALSVCESLWELNGLDPDQFSIKLHQDKAKGSASVNGMYSSGP